MASSPKVEYPIVQNYIVKFPWCEEASFLVLGWNVDRRFQFFDLGTGRIFNTTFDSVETADAWLQKASEVLDKNTIATTYVP